MSLTIQQLKLLELSLENIKGHMILMVKETNELNSAHLAHNPARVDTSYDKLQGHLGNARNSLQRFYQKL